MATVKAQLKRGLLQWIYDALILGTIVDDLGITVPPGVTFSITTLEQALIWFQRSLAPEIRTGKITTGSTGYQHGTTFAQPSVWRSLTPDELFAAAQEFREVYKDAVITATAAQAPSAVTDSCILAAMMADDRLQTVTRTQSDYTLIRLPWSRFS